jgi:uncharacterized membrane protein
MTWIYVILYILFGLITFFTAYILCIKQYLREKSALKFSYWIGGYYGILLFSFLGWFMVLPIGIIIFLLNTIINKINKHYNIR